MALDMSELHALRMKWARNSEHRVPKMRWTSLMLDQYNFMKYMY